MCALAIFESDRPVRPVPQSQPAADNGTERTGNNRTQTHQLL